MSRPGTLIKALLLPMALAALSDGPAQAARSSSTHPWTFSVRGEGQLRYDDNILGLSESEKDALDQPGQAGSPRFRVESPEDIIFVPDVSLELTRHPRKGLKTGIIATLRAYDYQRNSIKDYQQYALAVRQELNRSREHKTSLTVGGSHIPSYFIRPLRDDNASLIAGSSIFADADYTLNRGYLEVSQEIVNRLVNLSAGYAVERRDYNHTFDARDASSGVFYTEVNVYPMRSLGFRIRPYATFESRDTRGQLASTQVVDDEVGFDSDLYGADVRWLWGADADHRSVVRAFYEREKRDFTSDEPLATSHFGREDDIEKYGASYDKELGAAWRLAFSAYHRVNESTHPGSATNFYKNVVTAGVVYSFERRLGEPGE